MDYKERAQSFMDMFEREAASFRASPEGKAAQAKMDAYVSEGLDKALKGGLSDTVNWIGTYAEMADRVGLNAQVDAVYNKLSGAGYKIGDYINNENSQTDKYVMGRQIIEQTMAALSGEDGGEKSAPLISYAVACVDQYKKMRGKPVPKGPGNR